MSSLKQYPPGGTTSRVGCKVSWMVWPTREEAEKASQAARHNARVLEDQGFEWGFQSPGSIKPVADGFEVTLP